MPIRLGSMSPDFGPIARARTCEAHVVEDGEAGEARGVKNTPTIFVNGTEAQDRFQPEKLRASDRSRPRGEEEILMLAKKRKPFPGKN